VEWIRFLFFLDRIDGILFACGEMLSAEGSTILVILPNGFFKAKNPFLFQNSKRLVRILTQRTT